MAAQYAGQFPKLTLFTINEVSGSWSVTNKVHFVDGGLFDQVYQEISRTRK